MTRRPISLVQAIGFTLAVAALAGRADAQAFSRLVSFGDSLTDVGNTNAITFGISPGSGYFNGRYSNGPLWVDGMSGDLGLGTVTNSRAGGFDYATGGSKSGSGNVTPFPFINLPNAGTQINSFLASRTFGANDLVTLWTGANDFLDGQTNAGIPADNVRGHVQRLVDAGARSVVVVNLPPLGETPRFRTTGDRAAMNQRSAQFNALVAGHLDAIGAATPAATLYHIDVAGFFADALANPSAYGLANVTQPAMSAPAGTNADQYLFWDEVHPTRAGHALLADVAFETVTARTWATSAGAWTTAASWTQRRVPDSTSSVTIAGEDADATLSADAAVRKLTVGGDGPSAGGRLALSGTTRVAVADAFALRAGGTLALDLAPGDAGGRVAANGAATLAGTIALGFVEGYVGLPGTTATLVAYASLVGTPDVTFDNVTGLAGLRFEPTFDATALSIALTATPGDANLDASVNFTDLLALAQHYGQTADQNWLDGDFTFDGAVAFDDLLALAQAYGTSAASFDADWALARSLVPEPMSAIALLGELNAASRRRR